MFKQNTPCRFSLFDQQKAGVLVIHIFDLQFRQLLLILRKFLQLFRKAVPHSGRHLRQRQKRFFHIVSFRFLSEILGRQIPKSRPVHRRSDLIQLKEILVEAQIQIALFLVQRILADRQIHPGIPSDLMQPVQKSGGYPLSPIVLCHKQVLKSHDMFRLFGGRQYPAGRSLLDGAQDQI